MPVSLKRGGRGQGWRAPLGVGGGAHVAPGTYPDNSLSKSKLFLSFPESQNLFLPYYAKEITL